MFDDKEAEAVTGGTGRVRGAKEFVKDVRLFVFGNAVAGILDMGNEIFGRLRFGGGVVLVG